MPHERQLLFGVLAVQSHGSALEAAVSSAPEPRAVEPGIHGSVLASIGAPSTRQAAPDGEPALELEGRSTVTAEHPGRYTIKGEHGRGGIGRVLIAMDEHVGREVAIKELLPEALPGSTPSDGPRTPTSRTTVLMARFLREARVTGQLEHPAIVPVYEIGRRPDGTLYYTMKLVRGRTLATALAGHALGTPAYMSPEQAEGTIDEVDERSDIWSLGAVLFEILTGRPPFCGELPFEIIGKVMKDPVPEVRTLEPQAPVELAAIAAKALRRDKAGRYRAAKDLANDVEAYRNGGRVGAYTYSSWELLRRFVTRNRAAVSVAALAFVALIAVGVGSYARIQRELDRALKAEDLALEREHQANDSLAQALADKAREAYAKQDYLAAEVYASHALSLAARSDARGVLVAISNQWRPRLLETQSAPTGVMSQRLSDGSAWVNVEGNEIQVIDPVTLAVKHRLLGHGAQVNGAYASPDGTLLASTSDDTTVRLWDLATGTELRVLHGHKYGTNAAAWSPDGKTLASSGNDDVVIWDVASGQELQRLHPRFGGHPDGVVFAADGCLLLFAEQDWTRIWNRCTQREAEPLARNGMYPTTNLTPKSAWFAASNSAGMVHIWDLATRRLVLAFQAHHTDLNLKFSPDGRRLATGSWDTTVGLWDLPQGKLRAMLRGYKYFPSAYFLEQGTRLLTHDGVAGLTRLWDITEPQTRPLVLSHDAKWKAIAISLDGRVLAAGDAKGAVSLWDADTGEPRGTLEGASHGSVTTVAFKPDGRQLAVGYADSTVILWDLPSARPLSQFPGIAAAFSPDGTWLVTGSTKTNGCLVRLWEVGSNHLVTSFAGHTNTVPAVAFAPNGKLLATGGDDKRVRLWNPDTAQVVRILVGHESWVYALAFSPDSRLLATGGYDGTLRIWDTDTGEERAVIPAHNEPIKSLVFFPDGRTLATASFDQTVHFWSLTNLMAPGSELQERARRELGLVLHGVEIVGDSGATAAAESEPK